MEVKQKITDKDIKKANDILAKYKQGKATTEKRIIENEEWYRMRYGNKSEDFDDVKSPWLFNIIMNKHADSMDSFPEAKILPREPDDQQTAENLTDILPVILEHQKFKKVYSENMYPKLKNGTAVYGVFWDNSTYNGLGDVKVTRIDLLNIFWEPGIEDIQDSRNLFIINLADKDVIKEKYPIIKDKLLNGDNTVVSKYINDENVDTTDKVAVVDWYYKVQSGNKTILHLCKYCCDTVLYASENDTEPLFLGNNVYKQAPSTTGIYNHGKYPVVFDTLFPIQSSPTGFGFIDICKNEQLYIDKMNKLLIKNLAYVSKPRFFYRVTSGINLNEYADWDKTFIPVQGSLNEDNIKQIKVDTPDSSIYNFLQMKIDEIQQTSNNTEFDRGNATGGVTAASAITALQEAGNKVSRDIDGDTYESFKEICYLIIELIKQFYDETRIFRINGKNNTTKFKEFNNKKLKPLNGKECIFDIEVEVAKKSPYAQVATNELALNFYGAGMFDADRAQEALQCVDMMDFDKKNTVRERIEKNSSLLQELIMLRGIVNKITGIAPENTLQNQNSQITPNLSVTGGEAKANAIKGVVK